MIHEHRFGLSQRLNFSTLKNEFKPFTLRKPMKLLFNENYYLSLLPKEIQDLNDNQKRQEILEKQIDAFFDALQTEESSQLKARIANWLEKYDQSKPLKEHIIHFDPLAYKTKIHPASEENVNEYKQYTYTIKIPKKTKDLIPFDQLEIVQSLKALIQNEDPYETKTILRYVFNDILPDGKEIQKTSSDGQKITADDWMEKFVVEPADIELPSPLEAQAHDELYKKILAALFSKKDNVSLTN